MAILRMPEIKRNYFITFKKPNDLIQNLKHKAVNVSLQITYVNTLGAHITMKLMVRN